MSRDDDETTRADQRVRDALRDLPPVEADPRFRERLRREFRTGRLAPKRREPWRPWAAAAAVLLALLGIALFANRGQPWTVVATSGVGVVQIDGRTVDVTNESQLSALLVPGAVVTTDAQAELTLASQSAMSLVVTPESTVRLPDVPGRWFGRTVRASLDRGELRGITGRSFSGARLEIELPAAMVEITGTTFAVLSNLEGSCVCVLEGTVVMQDRTGVFPVGSGRRRVVPPDGTAPRDEPIRPMELMKLEMLRDQTRAEQTQDQD